MSQLSTPLREPFENYDLVLLLNAPVGLDPHAAVRRADVPEDLNARLGPAEILIADDHSRGDMSFSNHR